MGAGLPSITGDANTNQETGHDPTGVFYRSGDYPVGGVNGTFYRSNLFFDASLSNSIYGSSETVTPLSMSCVFCISY